MIRMGLGEKTASPAEIVRKDCGNIADIMRNTGGPAADATSECTTGPP